MHPNMNRLFLITIVLLFVHISSAQKLGAIKDKYVYVGIPQNEFTEIAAFGKQRSMNWCWAACIQMILNYNSIPVLQDQIVKRTLGKLIDEPADSALMFKALNGWEVDVYGRKVLVSSNFYSTDLIEITAFLNTNKPLIVGLQQENNHIGHAYVLIGIYYETILKNNGEKNYRPHSVILIDPWPGSNSINDMSWGEFVNRLSVSYKVWIN